MNRQLATSLLEIASATSVTIGATVWSVGAGFVVGGLFGLAFARKVAR